MTVTGPTATNVALEETVRAGLELPGFTTLDTSSPAPCMPIPKASPSRSSVSRTCWVSTCPHVYATSTT